MVTKVPYLETNNTHSVLIFIQFLSPFSYQKANKQIIVQYQEQHNSSLPFLMQQNKQTKSRKAQILSSVSYQIKQTALMKYQENYNSSHPFHTQQNKQASFTVMRNNSHRPFHNNNTDASQVLFPSPAHPRPRHPPVQEPLGSLAPHFSPSRGIEISTVKFRAEARVISSRTSRPSYL